MDLYVVRVSSNVARLEGPLPPPKCKDDGKEGACRATVLFQTCPNGIREANNNAHESKAEGLHLMQTVWNPLRVAQGVNDGARCNVPATGYWVAISPRSKRVT